MDKTVKTKRLRYAKAGEVIGIELGMFLKNAVELTRVYKEKDEYLGGTQIFGDGIIVEREGFSKIGVGRQVSVQLSW